MGKVVRTKEMYSLQMAPFLEHLRRLMMVMRQEFMEALEEVALRQY